MSSVETAVTVVVVPRERFDCAIEMLDTLFQNTGIPFDLIYIDGNSPSFLRATLQKEAIARKFQLISTDYYLPPNAARNMAIPLVKTPYVVFIDNDVLVRPDWLERLSECAEETGASIVGPLYLIGRENRIHMAGGTAQIREEDGRRSLVEQHRLASADLQDVSDRLQMEPCELVEFHCMLCRTAVFQKTGLLDEHLLSTPEHIDLCLQVRLAGGTIYFEPKAIVAYIPPTYLKFYELPFYFLRWSPLWNEKSLSHFCKKWNLPEDDAFVVHHRSWLRAHRRSLVSGESIPAKLLLHATQALVAVIECGLNPLVSSYSRKHHQRFLETSQALVTPAGGH